MQKCIVLCIKGVYRIQQTGKMVVDTPAPDKGIAVCIRFYFCTIYKKLFERDKAFPVSNCLFPDSPMASVEVIITVNGRGDTAVIGLEDYYQMKAELVLLRNLAEAEDDVREGRVGSMQESFDDIRATLLARKNA